jgi:hypothetical protein
MSDVLANVCFRVYNFLYRNSNNISSILFGGVIPFLLLDHACYMQSIIGKAALIGITYASVRFGLKKYTMEIDRPSLIFILLTVVFFVVRLNYDRPFFTINLGYIMHVRDKEIFLNRYPLMIPCNDNACKLFLP